MKRKLLAIFLCFVLVSATACGNENKKTNTKTETQQKEQETSDKTVESAVTVEWTLDQVKLIPAVIAGIDNITAEQSVEPLDLTSLVNYDKNIVTGVTIDDTTIDYNTPATYDATYNVTMNREAFEKYIKDHSVTGFEVNGDTKTFTAKIKVTVTIVAPEQAQQLEQNGTSVATADNTGTKQEKTNTGNSSGNSNSGNTGNTSGGSSGNTGGNSNSGSTNSGGNTNSGNSGGTTPSNTTPAPAPSQPTNTTPTPTPTQPTHQHQWQPHWATRVVREAYDEVVTKTVTTTEEHWFSNEDPSWDLTAEWQANRPDLPNLAQYLAYMGYAVACHTNTVPVEKQVTETVHHEAVTEQYIDYYYCADNSCGERHTPAELGKPDK